MIKIGYRLQYVGMVLIIGVMLFDHFVMGVRKPVMLAFAILAVIIITVGMQIVKRNEDGTNHK